MKKTYQLFILKYRRVIIIAANFFIIATSYYGAFLLRFDYDLSGEYAKLFLKTLPLLLVFKFLIFYYFGLFRGLWRYVSTSDLWQIIKANAVSSTIFVATNAFIFRLGEFPRSVFLIDFVICTFLTGGIRLLTRLIREKFRNIELPKKQAKVLIVGAGESGVLTLKEYQNNPALGEVVGFIDDDKSKHNESIRGIKILGDRNNIADIANTYEVEEIILALPSVSGKVIRDLISHCQIPGIKLKIVPGLTKILSGELEIKPRQVRPEDLLGREVVSINEQEIKKYLKDKKVLITGAAGSIGSELCRQAVNFSPSMLILLDHNENNLYFLTIELKLKYKNLNIKSAIGDINDIGLLKEIFSEHKPNVVFHAAAYKHVPLMEKNPLIALKNNVFGTRNIIYASHHYNVERFVLISTDKAVNPLNVMGMTKRLAEILLSAKAKHSKTKFMAVRFGNVLGSDGSVVPLFKKQIEAGGPITITHPETARYFMSIKEAVLLVLQAGAIGNGGEIFILDMGEQIKIVDLAKNLVTLSGLELDKDIFIEYIGLRPGEKIREELLLDKEKDKITKHDKIYISQTDNLDLGYLRKQMKMLKGYVNLMHKEEAIKKLREIIISVKNE
jgi:FlaA1/EpsC-like NDP-sugar epimerase